MLNIAPWYTQTRRWFLIKHQVGFETLLACPLCGGTQFLPQQAGPDYFLHSPGFFQFVCCSVCRFIFQNPRPPLEAIGQYYPQQYGSYASAQQGLKTRRGLLGAVIRRGQAKRSRLLDAHVQPRNEGPRRLLDVGCASGLFLESMQALPGWQVEGVELNETTARATGARLDVPVFAGPLEHADFAADLFDAITMWDVLEHLHNPFASLRELRRILRPGGVLFVRVPDGASYVAKLCGKYWSGYDLPRHMSVFTPRTLACMLSAAGFRRMLVRYPSGSYLGALHSLRFALDDGFMPAVQAERFHRVLLHPVARAAAWVPLSLADRVLGGSNIEVMVS